MFVCVSVQRDKAQEEAVQVSLVSRFPIVIIPIPMISHNSLLLLLLLIYVSLPPSQTAFVFILRHTFFHVHPFLFNVTITLFLFPLFLSNE